MSKRIFRSSVYYVYVKQLKPNEFNFGFCNTKLIGNFTYHYKTNLKHAFVVVMDYIQQHDKTAVFRINNKQFISYYFHEGFVCAPMDKDKHKKYYDFLFNKLETEP